MNTPRLSLLVGAHQFLWHPLLLAAAWCKLYGFPRDARLWAAFIVHDWGYWTCADLNGSSGQRHPELGGRIMTRLFGLEWGEFTATHSRAWASQRGARPSRLCAADKLACALEPTRAYVWRVRLSGEIREYRRSCPAPGPDQDWARRMQAECRDWALTNAGACGPEPGKTAVSSLPGP